MTHDEITKLDRVECAARVLIYVQDKMPGDDLVQEARALAMIELRAALDALNHYRGPEWVASFDPLASLEELKRQRTR